MKIIVKIMSEFCLIGNFYITGHNTHIIKPVKNNTLNIINIDILITNRGIEGSDITSPIPSTLRLFWLNGSDALCVMNPFPLHNNLLCGEFRANLGGIILFAVICH